MAASDYYSAPALQGGLGGAGTGALIGGSFGGPPGALVGGLIGGGLGLYSGAQGNSQRDEALRRQMQLAEQLSGKMRSASAGAYDQYISGLNKALSFYGPVNERWNYLYGTGTGQGGLMPTGMEPYGPVRGGAPVNQPPTGSPDYLGFVRGGVPVNGRK